MFVSVFGAAPLPKLGRTMFCQYSKISKVGASLSDVAGEKLVGGCWVCIFTAILMVKLSVVVYLPLFLL